MGYVLVYHPGEFMVKLSNLHCIESKELPLKRAEKYKLWECSVPSGNNPPLLSFNWNADGKLRIVSTTLVITVSRVL